MATSYSARSRAIEPFHVMALLARANELQAAGHDVIHLEIGEPDFTTAEPIVEAGRAALAAGHTRYTAARGLPALREAIAKFYGERYGVDLDPQRVLVTPGGSGALLLASSLLVDPTATGCSPTRATRATGISCAWWKAPRNWCRWGRTAVTN